MLLNMGRVVFFSKAFEKISQCIMNAQKMYEVGGILMGYSCFGVYFVMEVSLPARNSPKCNMSFIINGEREASIVEKIQNKYLYPPYPIGIWHSHTNSMETFSKQDKISNQKFYENFGEFLSIIAVQSEPMKRIRLITYYVSNHRYKRLYDYIRI